MTASFATRPARVTACLGLYILLLSGGLFLHATTAWGISGSIYADSTWSGSIAVDGDVVVQPGATLIILPGTTVRFAANTSSYDDELGTTGRCDLIVLGGMTAVGGSGASEGIVLDSNAPTPAPGSGARSGSIRSRSTRCARIDAWMCGMARWECRLVSLTVAGRSR